MRYLVVLLVLLSACIKHANPVPMDTETINIPHQTLPLVDIPEHQCGELAPVPCELPSS